ncbi:MAG: sigma-54-dependent transcriptional regulator [Firmicutes bacterium]|nr:sigma-54-dependent transcriptional regulator [Bacillota bacterium]
MVEEHKSTAKVKRMAGLDVLERALHGFVGPQERIIDYLLFVLNSTHDGMIAVNSRGIVTIVNSAAEAITGLKSADVVGRPAEEVIPNTRLHIVARTGKAELNQQQDTGKTVIITNRVPVRDKKGDIAGAVAVFRDITEVKHLAEEITNLREIQSMLEAIINSTQDAISVVDAEGKGLMINPAYTRLTGLTGEDVIGKPPTVDIAEGESMHLLVLETMQPVTGVPMKVGPGRREVLVDVAPILVAGGLKGSVAVIHDKSEIIRLTEELDRVKHLVRRLEAKYTFEDIVAESPLMKSAVDQARRAARTPATVLLRGESGTGKELFAHAIHNLSQRKSGPFVRVNCAAIAESLLESELFGYVEGAFTGARRGGRRGMFEEADRGTIFLDEVGVMNLNLQSKILRVLQEKEVMRVGDTTPTKINVRIIAATNVNLEQAMENGKFREDLYYRLNVIPILIPPLRQRRGDIPGLVYWLIRKFNQEYGRSLKGASGEALERLCAYDWPGNVRELENILGRAIINMKYSDTLIETWHLPALGRPEPVGRAADGLAAGAGAAQGGGEERLVDLMRRVEREAILSMLRATGWNKTESARRLGIATRSLYYKMERLGLTNE